MARNGTKWFIVVDGEEVREYDGIVSESNLVFDSPNRFHTLAIRGIEFLLVEVEIVGES
ncbi:MAG: hypothetical protein RMK18_09375 [Armatimonadota bacterium]|nr:hypothetical protein [Armatimonadota bacterium]MCX7778474.1 hypothetical protein [Armatimonadota bacterium]MDW8026053.1 hypothetical protein [Armatimonadota bacterium]